MSKFPKPIVLPNSVNALRTKRGRSIVKAAKLGVLFRLFVIVFELVGVAWINSSALFVDAISSLTDVVASLFLIFCIKLADRPPDEDHPFGHGRYEPLGGFLTGMLLIALGGVMLAQQFFGVLQESVHGHLHPLAWLFPAVALVVLEIAYRLMIRIAKSEHSPALAADEIHYRIDSLTSLLATLTLVLAMFLPEMSVAIDHAGAVVIAIFMMTIGIWASRENFHQLMDRVPEEKYFTLVRKAAHQVSGIKGTEKIRIQQYGPDAHVDIDVEVDPNLTVKKAHQMSQLVRAEIQKAWPCVQDVTVHIEPYYANDH